jgi:glycosyltransferase 2 family protein
LKKLILKILEFAGFFAIGLLLLYFAFKGIDLEKLISDFKSVRYSWILLSLSFASIAYLCRAYRWKLIIEPLNYFPSFRSTFYSLMVGYLANFAFPRIGEVTRCVSLSKKEKIPVDKLLGTVIIERAVDLLSLGILLILLLIIRLDTFGSFIGNNVLKPLYDKILETLAFSKIIWVLILVLIVSGIASYYIFKEQLSSVRVVVKLKNLIKGVIDGLKTIYKMKRRWEFLLYTLIIWTMYLLMTWVAVFSIPSTSHLNLIDGMFILVIGGLGMSAPVQAGIGAYHWIVSRGLAIVYATTISLEEGLVFATISHGSQAILAIVLGSASFFLLLGRKK